MHTPFVWRAYWKLRSNGKSVYLVPQNHGMSKHEARLLMYFKNDPTLRAVQLMVFLTIVHKTTRT
eukprot:3460117-Amphidinium_carterae.1